MATYAWTGIRIAALALAPAMCPPASAQFPAPEHGMASFYDVSFNGQRAASGELYDQEQLTAAHRTLPFGTRVRVRRLDSEESIVVRINDRGPYVESRIIDLSYAAARKLGMTAPGLIPVAIDVVEMHAVPEANIYVVQAGSFRDPANARRTQAALEEKYGAARIVVEHRRENFWCVLVGKAATQAEAQELARKVRQGGPAFRSAFVMRVGVSTVSGDLVSGLAADGPLR